ncbi:MAG: hypothetical protein PVJ39_04635 [Gammaproteobacteria bacterium]|jgi:hypothetical protein
MSAVERVKRAMLDNKENNFNVSWPSLMAKQVNISPSYACSIMRKLMSEGFCRQRYCHGPYEVI